MGLPAGARHDVAVVRVEVRDGDGTQLIIELLEVGRDRDADRLLGRATSVVDACRVLRDWLVGLRSDGADDRPGAATDDGVTPQ
jgi:hypothetical protein